MVCPLPSPPLPSPPSPPCPAVFGACRSTLVVARHAPWVTPGGRLSCTLGVHAGRFAPWVTPGGRLPCTLGVHAGRPHHFKVATAMYTRCSCRWSTLTRPLATLPPCGGALTVGPPEHRLSFMLGMHASLSLTRAPHRACLRGGVGKPQHTATIAKAINLSYAVLHMQIRCSTSRRSLRNHWSALQSVKPVTTRAPFPRGLASLLCPRLHCAQVVSAHLPDLTPCCTGP